MKRELQGNGVCTASLWIRNISSWCSRVAFLFSLSLSLSLTHKHTLTSTCSHARSRAHKQTHVSIHVFLLAHSHACSCARAHTHTHTHKHTRTHTNTHHSYAACTHAHSRTHPHSTRKHAHKRARAHTRAHTPLHCCMLISWNTNASTCACECGHRHACMRACTWLYCTFTHNACDITRAKARAHRSFSHTFACLQPHPFPPFPWLTPARQRKFAFRHAHHTGTHTHTYTGGPTHECMCRWLRQLDTPLGFWTCMVAAPISAILSLIAMLVWLALWLAHTRGSSAPPSPPIPVQVFGRGLCCLLRVMCTSIRLAGVCKGTG